MARTRGGIDAGACPADSVAGRGRGLVLAVQRAPRARRTDPGVRQPWRRCRRLARSSLKWERVDPARARVSAPHGVGDGACLGGGRDRQPGRACCLRWIRSLCFRSAIHLHGSAPHRESGVVSGARARAARGGAHQGKHDHAPGRPRVAAGARTDGETLCTASGAGTAWARSAARFRSARRGGRWAAAISSAKGNERPRPRGSRPAGLRARPQRAGYDCDASSLQRSRP